MRTSTQLLICTAVILLAVGVSNKPARAFCIWGFGQCERSSPIASEYVQDGNANKTLTITADKITLKSGPVSFSADYVVQSVDGKNVTIEMSPSKDTLQIQVEANVLKIRDNPNFFGDWKKK